jgi:thiol-disulfide isomerase/thioredoxin
MTVAGSTWVTHTTLAVVAVLVTSCSGPDQKPGGELELGKRSGGAGGVQMTLPRLGGGRVALSELRGNPVVITLFTTWCLRCQAEAPLFVQLHEHGEGRGLRILGIALDHRGRPMVETYVEHVGFAFDVLLANPTDLELIGGLGITRQVPRTVLLNRKGAIVQDHHKGQTDFDRLRKGVEALLGR